MDFCSVVESLRNKSILITGSTGFLAKVFVEKVLRIQPDVKRVYLLIRAPNKAVAEQRVKNEVLDKDLFNVLRENHESFFESFISGKVTPIVGNVAHELLGIEEPGMREQLWREVDVIINSSATTNFDERYDVALDTNTLGVKHAMDFAKKCLNLEVFVHVSTAFVAGEKVGVILERPFRMGETLKGNSTLDIDTELKLAKERLEELSDKDANEKAKTTHMKELGLERARLFGWPNTYVFTKAMGEMLLGHLRDHIPLVILRPTIITSTYREPFPGWIEGTRTIDTVLVNYAKGKLKCFVLDPKSIMDIIPCDMVVNAMIMTMAAHSHQSSLFIYHLCSSVRNPLTYTNLVDLSYCFFSKQPWLGHGGKPIKVDRLFVLHTMSSFYRYMILHYKLPLQGFRVVNAVSFHVFHKRYTQLNRNYNYAVRVAQLYKPYVFFKGRFDDSNSEGFWEAMDAGQEAKMLHYDTKCINWEDYFLTIHFPGVVKYLIK